MTDDEQSPDIIFQRVSQYVHTGDVYIICRLIGDDDIPFISMAPISVYGKTFGKHTQCRVRGLIYIRPCTLHCECNKSFSKDCLSNIWKLVQFLLTLNPDKGDL
jgi:hypothetical protein